MTRDSENNEGTRTTPSSLAAGSGTHRVRPRNAPAAERNTSPILDVLKAHLPASGHALEVASGMGQHAATFARRFPDIVWQPSDPDIEARASIAAWAEQAGVHNLLPPLDIDVTHPGWHEAVEPPLTAIIAINLMHISPWAVTEGLLRGAGLLLAPGGVLYLYGPYTVGGEHTAQSNVRFEEWLKSLSPEYGVRDMADVEREANTHGLTLSDVVDMPANNFSLVFRKG